MVEASLARGVIAVGVLCNRAEGHPRVAQDRVDQLLRALVDVGREIGAAADLEPWIAVVPNSLERHGLGGRGVPALAGARGVAGVRVDHHPVGSRGDPVGVGAAAAIAPLRRAGGGQGAEQGLLAAIDHGGGPVVGITVRGRAIQAPAVVAIGRLATAVVRVRVAVPVAKVDHDVGPVDRCPDLRPGGVRGVDLHHGGPCRLGGCGDGVALAPVVGGERAGRPNDDDDLLGSYHGADRCGRYQGRDDRQRGDDRDPDPVGQRGGTPGGRAPGAGTHGSCSSEVTLPIGP